MPQPGSVARAYVKVFPLFLLMLAAACQRDEVRTGFIVTDSAGVRIATNNTPVAMLRQVIAADSTQVAAIGVAAGEAQYMFHRISDATRLESGHIVVADETQELRVFDPAGKHIVTYGGKGQGPGEFLSISDIVAQHGDTLLVWDRHAMQYSSFSVTNGFLARAATRRKNLSDLLIKDFYYEHMYPVADGSLIVEVTTRAPYSEKENARPTGEWLRPLSTLVWVNPGFTSYRKLGDHGGIEQIRLIVAGVPTYYVAPAGRRPHHSIGGNPARVCIDGMNGAQVDCFDADGSQTYIRWHNVPVPLPDGAFDNWIEREAGMGGRHAESPEQVRAALAGVPRINHMAPVSGIHVDAEGFVWVSSPDLKSESGLMRHRIFDRKGELVGYASTSPMQILEIGSDYMLGIVRTIDGEESLVMHRIRRDRTIERSVIRPS